MSAILCPRCRSTAVSEVAYSPVPDVWSMSSCSMCWYAWRSTEGPSARDPEQYPKEFRLSAGDLTSAPTTV